MNIQQDPLLTTRTRIALHSLNKSHIRIAQQQKLLQQYDETQLDQIYDQRVFSSTGFQNVLTEYGDSSALAKGVFNNKGDIYVTVGASGQGKVWAIAENQQQGGLGKIITELKSVDKLWDVDVHPNIGNIPAFAPNIITGTTLGQLLIWTYDRSLSAQKSIKIKAHEDRINNVKFHQTGSVFFTASYDKSWSIWDSSRIKLLSNQKGHHKQIHTLSLHPDGSLLLTGDLGGDGMIWDLRTGKGIYQFQCNNSMVCSSFHPNGFQFVIGGKNNMINIFDLRRKKQIKAIPAHLKLVSDLAYSSNGAILFSGSHDNTVKMWHGRNYYSVGSELEHPSKITSIAYCNNKLAVTMLDRKWTLWSNKKTKIQNIQPQTVKLQNTDMIQNE